MNCDVCSKAIPLYRELSKIEKTSLDQHIMQCDACKKLFNQQILFENFTRKAASAHPQYAHPEFAKHQILKSITQVGSPIYKRSWLSTENLNFIWARFALYSVSALLVILFFLENNNEPYTAHNKTIQTKRITINYNNLRDSFNKRDREKSLLLTPHCVASLGHKDLNCLKSKLKTFTYDTQ